MEHINLNNDTRTFLNQKCPIIGGYQDKVSSKSYDINMAATKKGVHPYVETAFIRSLIWLKSLFHVS